MVLMLLLGFAGFTVSADVAGSNGSKYACITFKEWYFTSLNYCTI